MKAHEKRGVWRSAVGGMAKAGATCPREVKGRDGSRTGEAVGTETDPLPRCAEGRREAVC